MPTEQTEKIQKVMQVLPDIEIHQFKPTLKIPVGLDEPTTLLGKVAVVLYNRANSKIENHHRVTRRTIREMLRAHRWAVEGVDEVIDQLLHWEILVAKGTMLYIKSERIKMIPHAEEIEIK